MAKMGRPSQWTQEKIELLESVCKMKPTLQDCAEILKMDTSTIEKWIKRTHGITFSEFRERKMAWTRNMIIRGLIKKAQSGDLGALIYCSKNLCGWSDRPQQETDSKVIINYSMAPEKKSKDAK